MAGGRTNVFGYCEPLPPGREVIAFLLRIVAYSFVAWMIMGFPGLLS